MEPSLVERKRCLLNLWQGKERGPLYSIGVAGRSIPRGKLVEDFFLMLEVEKERLRLKENIRDYDIPAIRTDFGTAIFPSAFGCPLSFSEAEYPWSEPVIFDDPRKVYRLPRPSLEAGLLSRVLRFTALVVSSTEYPVKMTDLQGPIDT
ncbi:MAG: hypothetical protein ACP5Q4_07740, partial [Candidatus Caldatribacteriaceae bacterium]